VETPTADAEDLPPDFGRNRLSCGAMNEHVARHGGGRSEHQRHDEGQDWRGAGRRTGTPAGDRALAQRQGFEKDSIRRVEIPDHGTSSDQRAPTAVRPAQRRSP
jgi:hypothetical protein